MIVKALAGHVTPNTYIGALPHKKFSVHIKWILATEANLFLRLHLPDTVGKNGRPTMGDPPRSRLCKLKSFHNKRQSQRNVAQNLVLVFVEIILKCIAREYILRVYTT